MTVLVLVVLSFILGQFLSFLFLTQKPKIKGGGGEEKEESVYLRVPRKAYSLYVGKRNSNI